LSRAQKAGFGGRRKPKGRGKKGGWEAPVPPARTRIYHGPLFTTLVLPKARTKRGGGEGKKRHGEQGGTRTDAGLWGSIFFKVGKRRGERGVGGGEGHKERGTSEEKKKVNFRPEHGLRKVSANLWGWVQTEQGQKIHQKLPGGLLDNRK